MSFKNVPTRCIPLTPYKTNDFVYRAVYGPIIEPKSFLPSFVDLSKRNKTENLEMLFQAVKDEKDCDDFSCSVYLDLDIMLAKLYGSVISKKRPYLAKGLLNDNKGIADKPDSDLHISYYLEDYEDKNPFDDFEIIGLLEDYLK
jgi:hypothetical protein